MHITKTSQLRDEFAAEQKYRSEHADEWDEVRKNIADAIQEALIADGVPSRKAADLWDGLRSGLKKIADGHRRVAADTAAAVDALDALVRADAAAREPQGGRGFNVDK